MIKCKYFTRNTEFRPTQGTVVLSAMYLFNEWDQADVESIISIDTCANQNGEVETIVVYYNAKELPK
jgi:hypothetical protein